MQKDISCNARYACEVTVATRSACSACRLRKCLQVGMKSDYISKSVSKHCEFDRTALLKAILAFITCAGNKRLSSQRKDSSTAFADPMAHQPELLRVVSSDPLSVLPNSLAASHAQHKMGMQMDNQSGQSFSRARHTVYHKRLCERHRQSERNSSSSIAPVPQAAHLALEYAPAKASEHSIWGMLLRHSRTELEPGNAALPMGCLFSTTRPKISSGCLFSERKPAPAMQHGAILSSADGIDRMAQFLMRCRGTLSLGRIAGRLRRELISCSRFSHSLLINSTGVGFNTPFQSPLLTHQSYFNFPNFSVSRSTTLPEGQAAYSTRQLGSPRDPRIMQQVDHTILTHHLFVTPSHSANYSLDVTSISICSGVVCDSIFI